AMGRLIVEAEDILSADKTRLPVALVVLASGMVSNLADGKMAGAVALDKDHFVVQAESGEGIFAAGCAKGPFDVATSVQDATAAAAQAIEAIHTAGRR
ncbi:MAG: heterodisulfide reductase subunit A, partial [Candidatus Rokubacteria bacterium]|nr:heterodisulfide reductase subunit A [Candidatus Rokubacteria bacterium]